MAKATLTTGQVITIGDGRFACSVVEIYSALNTLLDDNLFTHQLPRGARHAEKTVIEACPWVTDLPKLDFNQQGTKEEIVRAWVASISAKVGDTHEIPDASEGWQEKNPVIELTEMKKGK